MMQEVPPLIERPKTVVGVGARELIVLGVFGLLSLSMFLLPASFVLRIGLATLFVGCGAAAAFARDPHSGKTLEAYLADRLRFAGRERFWQRGAGEMEAQETGWAAAPEIPLRKEQAHVRRIEVQALPLTAGLWLSIVSLAMLASLLAWIWLGGLQEILIWFSPGFGR